MAQRCAAQKGDANSGHRALAQQIDNKNVALVDALGNLVRCILLDVGQAQDMKGVAPLNRGVPFGTHLTDKTFDADWLLKELDARGEAAVRQQSFA